jgi:excisionase family DNA binding protein
MAKFLPLEEAAKLLGISVDELSEARENNHIHGYRDGTSWKFKDEEVERYKNERAAGGKSKSSGESDLLRVPGLLDDDDDESVLVSDDDSGLGSGMGSSLGPGSSGKGKKSSTIIGVEGGKTEGKRASDSDLMIAGDLGSGSDNVLSGGSSGKMIKPPHDSDVELIAADDGSDVKIVPGGTSGLLGEPHESELKLDLNPSSTGSGTGELGGSSGDSLGIGSSDLEDEEDLSLGDDEDLVLSGSGTGSDVTMGGSDTGINLAKPSDSGLLLDDEALDLGSVSSLELPEDDEGLELEDEPIVKKDEEFLLSPADAGVDDGEETSGSQIIELDPTFTEAVEITEPGALEPEEDAIAVGPTGDVQYVSARPETPYSVYNVFFLGVTVVFLAVCGILMLDMVRNMWHTDTAKQNPVASMLLDTFKNM